MEGNDRLGPHEDGLRALAGIMEGGADALGLRADWLRNQTYLYHFVQPTDVARISTCMTDGVIRYLARSGLSLAGCAKVACLLENLYKEFTAAIHCFQTLRHLRGATAEEYWDSAALASVRLAIDWASFGREYFFDHNGWRAAMWLTKHRVVSGSSVLQVGCGIGRIEKHLGPRIERVYGVDISQQMVNLARHRLQGVDNVSIWKNDGAAIELPSESIDSAFSLLVFIDVFDTNMRGAILAQVHRVLAPGGRFFVTTSNFETDLIKAADDAGFTLDDAFEVDTHDINSFQRTPDWAYSFSKSTR